MREDADWIQYKDSWNEKWQIVKDIMCGRDYHYSEQLANVRDIVGTSAEESGNANSQTQSVTSTAASR